MADKYALATSMVFDSVQSAGKPRAAIETALSSGFTTLGDYYLISVIEETGTCQFSASLRFEKKSNRDKVVSVLRAEKANTKPNTAGRVQTHVCKHDAAAIGYGSCVDIESDEWGKEP